MPDFEHGFGGSTFSAILRSRFYFLAIVPERLPARHVVPVVHGGVACNDSSVLDFAI